MITPSGKILPLIQEEKRHIMQIILLLRFLRQQKRLRVHCPFRKIWRRNISDIGFCIAVNSGEPVSESDKLFGDTIRLAKRMCAVAKENQIAIASNVRELVSQDYFKNNGNNILNLSPVDETLLDSLFNTLEEHYADPDLNVTDYCQKMAMSQSQLYRKTMCIIWSIA